MQKYNISTSHGAIMSVPISAQALKNIEEQLNNTEKIMVNIGDTIIRSDTVINIAPLREE